MAPNFGERCWQECHLSKTTHILTSEYGTPSKQATQQLYDEELLLELPLLRLGTDGAATIEIGGDIVRPAVGAPGKLPKAPNARTSFNSANTANKRLNSTLQRASPKFKNKHVLKNEGWDWGMILHP